MRDNDGRKLDHATLEAMRTRAVAKIQAGAHPDDVAAVLGLHRSTVFGWVPRYREGGPDALRAKPVPGRPPKPSVLDEAGVRSDYHAGTTWAPVGRTPVAHSTGPDTPST
jgi:transposase